MNRIRQNKRGLSNVVVAMLSLLLVIIIVSNVILWSYQMNQVDWERMHEDLRIAEISPISSPWFVAQDEYSVNIGNWMNGTYRDTQAVDNQHESFMEGLDWWNQNYNYRRQATITNNAQTALRSNYSICVTINTTSLFLEGKILSDGDDLRVAYRSQRNWIELDREINNMNSSTTQIWFETQTTIETAATDNNYFIYYGNPTAENPPANQSRVFLWFDDFNRTDNPDITTEPAYSAKTGGGIWSIQTGTLKNLGASGDPNKLIITALGNVSSPIDMFVKINVTSFAGGDNSRMGLSLSMDTDTQRGSGYCGLFHNDRNSLDLLNDLRSWGTEGTYSWSLNTWYYMRFMVIDPPSRLGKIKVWQVGTTEPTTWTVDGNFGGGTARDWGEVGFAGSRTTDITYFDDIAIRYTISPEPEVDLGEEERQVNNVLDLNGTFVIELSAYRPEHIQTVEIQTRYRSSDTSERWYWKAYNWTSSTYSDNGFNSTTGHAPTWAWEYYTLNMTDQWRSYVDVGGTVNVKLVDEHADTAQTTIDIDFLAVRVAADGTEFAFENKGALACHLVALWVDNSTHHQRYDLNLFIDSGEIMTYTRLDVKLPNRPYLIKVITERGNIAIYSEN